MFRFVIYLLLAVCAVKAFSSLSFEDPDSQDVDSWEDSYDKNGVEDESLWLEDFMANSDFEIEYNQFGEIKNYHYGHREPGDRVVYDHEDQIASKLLHDVNITVQYPESGNRGAYITYIRVEVHQTSAKGSCHISAGGLHKNFIKFHISVQQTKQFAYNINVYGKCQ
jgi:hypothetical protein